MRDDRARIQDILRAITRIEGETRGGRVAFDNDPKLQVWVLYNLQTIGEACRGLSEDFRSQHSDPVWSNAIGLRNILVHHYFEIDLDLVWQVVDHDLRSFRQAVERALSEIAEL